MLARPGREFDSDDFLFEIKWDGIRVVAYIGGDAGLRMLNRRGVDITNRYPEFSFLSQLQAGTVIDGEIVALRDGKPSFDLLMTRERARNELKIRSMSRTQPVTYIAFDLLYDQFHSIMDEPLQGRRDRLARIVKQCNQPQLVLSEAIIGKGKAFFQEVSKLGLEGMIAKRLDSRYQPGQRTDAWVKVKKGATVCCAIIGYEPDDHDDFRSLILAADQEGTLRYVGKVGSGIDSGVRKTLNALVRESSRAKPFVPCKIKGKWVEPGLYCLVHYMEQTANGHLRMPVFKELVKQ
jgi:DNA ligase D-like protein (predicted ligase)